MVEQVSDSPFLDNGYCEVFVTHMHSVSVLRTDTVNLQHYTVLVVDEWICQEIAGVIMTSVNGSI